MNKATDSSSAKVFLAAIICHVFWGFSFLASKQAQGVAHIFVLLSHRFLIAFILMSLLIPLRIAKLSLRGKGKRALLLIVLGIAEPVVYFFGEQYGILHSNTIFSGVMIAMIPVVSTVAAAPILGERPTVGQLIFSLISVGGVIGIGLMSKSSGSLDWIGVAALAVAVISATVYSLLSRRLSAEFSAFERTYMMMGVGAVVFTVLGWITAGSAVEYFKPFAQPTYTLSIAFLSVCCSVISYFLGSYAIGKMSVARVTVFANLTTAVSVFAGAVFLREPFSWLGLVFCLLILLGIYGVQRTARKDEKGGNRT